MAHEIEPSSCVGRKGFWDLDFFFLSFYCSNFEGYCKVYKFKMLKVKSFMSNPGSVESKSFYVKTKMILSFIAIYEFLTICRIPEVLHLPQIQGSLLFLLNPQASIMVLVQQLIYLLIRLG